MEDSDLRDVPSLLRLLGPNIDSAALRRVLDRLADPHERAAFEQRIAVHLAGGWLFSAAFEAGTEPAPDEERPTGRGATRVQEGLWIVALCILLAGVLVQVRKVAEEGRNPRGRSVAEPPPKRTDLPEDIRQRIEQGIEYEGSVKALPATMRYQVFLGADRQVVFVKPAEPPAQPAFDAAVERAARRVEPYPADMAATFTFAISPPSRGTHPAAQPPDG